MGKIDETKLDTVHHYYKFLPPPPIEQVKFTKPKKDKVKCTTIQTESSTTTGIIAAVTTREPEIMGGVDTIAAPSEIIGKPTVEEQPKSEK